MNKNRDSSVPSVVLQSSILAPVFCCKVLAPVFRKVLATTVGYLDFNKVRRFSSKVVHNGTLHPWFVSGLTNGEGSFTIILVKDKNYKCG
jgi:hypothetical protein